MRTGVCPKCESDNVYFKPQGIVYSGNPEQAIFISTTEWFLEWSDLDSFVCTRCGYFETYIKNPSILGKISESWGKVE